MDQSNVGNLGLNLPHIWQAVITGYQVIEFGNEHPIWGNIPDDDPSRAVVYKWEPVGPHMFQPDKVYVPGLIDNGDGSFDCTMIMGNRLAFAVNLARRDSRLRYDRVPIGTPVLMCAGRPPVMQKQLQDCNPGSFPLDSAGTSGGGLVEPSPFVLGAPWAPWIWFIAYTDPLSIYCDCDTDGSQPDRPPCPEY